jgi:propanol-preferring alcohol dehydrogenase
MAIQLAKPATGARIIAMDLDDEKLKLVKQNRTDNNINSKNEDAANVVIELSNKLGADAVIDFVNVSKTVETDTQLLRRRAKLVLVGLLDYELKQNLITISSRAYKLIGSYVVSITDLIEIVSLGKRGGNKTNYFKSIQTRSGNRSIETAKKIVRFLVGV